MKLINKNISKASNNLKEIQKSLKLFAKIFKLKCKKQRYIVIINTLNI